MKLVVNKFQTFHEADAATLEYYRNLSPEERLEIFFQLRAMAHKGDANIERVAPVYRIAQLRRG